MFEKEAKEYSTSQKIDYVNNIAITLVKQAYKDGAEFGYEQGIGRLRYCCTCKKWKDCGVESMYGICADWEIKEE